MKNAIVVYTTDIAVSHTFYTFKFTIMDAIYTRKLGFLKLVPSRVNNEDVQTQTTEEESEPESQTDTDVESAASSSVNTLAWQDDPEFQAKVK